MVSWNDITLYIFIGLIWVIYCEMEILKKEERWLTNQERFLHLLLYPIWMLVWIIGFIIGFIKGGK